jgi:hypothetical protein
VGATVFKSLSYIESGIVGVFCVVVFAVVVVVVKYNRQQQGINHLRLDRLLNC